MPKVFIYVVVRDLGFAPNPFHGYCSLATCKPRIRNAANVNDWVIGVGGRRLKAAGRCVYAMKVTRKVTFNEYWNSAEFSDKRPVRNGTPVMLVGDNIYHQQDNGIWQQAHSHHSLPDGSVNEDNLTRDTGSKYVLLSRHFYYFGKEAPEIPPQLLAELDYENRLNHRTYEMDEAKALVMWLERNFGHERNMVMADPFDFEITDIHYSVSDNRMSR